MSLPPGVGIGIKKTKLRTVEMLVNVTLRPLKSNIKEILFSPFAIAMALWEQT